MKSPAKRLGEEKTEIKKISNTDFNFNVSFNLETDYKLNSSTTANIVKDWNSSKKTFRLINRIRFEHKTCPIAVDLSILRNSHKSNGVMIPVYHIQDSGVFHSQEFCEIELEVINERVGPGKDFDHADKLLHELQLVIKNVVCGLHSAKYPIPYSVQEAVLESYSKLVFGEARPVLTTRDFIGPNSCTLQLKNIVDNENTNEPNIRDNYCITDKADGERKLMYINKEGKVYLIDTNMRVEFTGCIVDPNLCSDTILDGEHIKFDRNKQYKNMYMAFDIYFLKKESVRDKLFMKRGDLDAADLSKFRYLILVQLVEEVNKTLRSFIKDARPDIEVNAKYFYFSLTSTDIFSKCAELLTRMNDHIYPYETDGIIFTPMNMGLGRHKLEKFTWPQSLKWKPPEFNTIDFLVTYKMDSNKNEIIQTAFEDGLHVASDSIRKYRTLVLMCGFNKKSKMIYNPFQDLLDDNIPTDIIGSSSSNQDTYVPKPFLPSLPYDPNACFANIYLDSSETMFTEAGEHFEKNMIVEFKYDLDREDGWRWVPLRVRHDKTYEFRSGNKNFGNSYHVANENWKSIHFPITREMLCGSSIPENWVSDEIYYNSSGTEKRSHTRGLRNFHNLYVKKLLITGVAKENDTLIDYAVGKGGDIPKWKQSRLKFVFGIDYAIDNITNQYDGACVRYLNERKQTPVLFDALFVSGNSSLNLRDGTAFASSKERAVANAVFGNAKLNSELGKAVTKNHGIGKSGFNISSCQFALHYFFENNSVLHNFLRNVAECTRVDGFFIGTCFDGATVFEKLKNVDNYSIFVDDVMIFDLQKKFSQTGFVSDETSVGYAINVYQESINNYVTEYLVNFNYFVRLMENYGFKLLSNEEAKHFRFPSGSGLFSELFHQMKQDGNPMDMTEKEKTISFLNRYFIFRKTHDVNAEKVAKSMKVETVNKRKSEDNGDDVSNKKEKKNTQYVRRLKQKVVLKAP
jgi:mRNA (guanine-N7-)-methyltransferase